jgi:hypothetical protein
LPHKLFRRDEFVVGTIQDKDLGLNHPGLSRLDGCQASMKTRYAPKVHPLPGHIEHHFSSEAIADGREAGRVNENQSSDFKILDGRIITLYYGPICRR